MSKEFILIDFENVQPTDWAALPKDRAVVKVFLGATQSKLSTDMVLALQDHAAAVEYIRVPQAGANALDFCLAYCLGQLVLQHPDAQFRIVSKDSGFDPLLALLKEKGVTVDRAPTASGPVNPAKVPTAKPKAAKPAKRAKPGASAEVASAGVPASGGEPAAAEVTPLPPSPRTQPPADSEEALAEFLLAHLRQLVHNRPKTADALTRYLRTVAPKVSDALRTAATKRLLDHGEIMITDSVVSYPWAPNGNGEETTATPSGPTEF